MNQLKKQIRSAQDLFVRMIPVINAETNDLTADEAVAWWAGFTSAMAGCAAASIGHEALTVIAEAAQEAAQKCMAADAKNKH